MDQYDDLVIFDEKNEVTRVEEVQERQIEGFLEHNPFQAWAENIFENSKKLVYDGNGLNAMYMPTLVPYISHIYQVQETSTIMVRNYGTNIWFWKRNSYFGCNSIKFSKT